MKLAILSRGPKSYSTRRLKEAAHQRGHDVKVLNTMRFSIDVGIRQRLTVSRGYGVAELHIPEGSDYLGKSIADSGLRERDINVLSLHRDAKVIPNPKAERVLEAHDRLLCFGKLDEMRGLVPPRTRKKRRPTIGKLDPG